MDLSVVALHGFLGSPKDWEPTASAFPEARWHCPDYTLVDSISAKTSLKQWAEAFAIWIQQQKTANKKVFVGYSQGARLGMHLLKEHHELFDFYFFISAQAFFSDKNGVSKEIRYKNDLDWGKRFSQENWQDVLRAWNSQPIFKNSAEPNRSLPESHRHVYEDCLKNWSLALQEDLSPTLEKLGNKILFIVGEHDHKYQETTVELQNKTNLKIQCQEIKNAGHRILFDQPALLGNLIKNYCSKI